MSSFYFIFIQQPSIKKKQKCLLYQILHFSWKVRNLLLFCIWTVFPSYKSDPHWWCFWEEVEKFKTEPCWKSVLLGEHAFKSIPCHWLLTLTLCAFWMPKGEPPWFTTCSSQPCPQNGLRNGRKITCKMKLVSRNHNNSLPIQSC